MKRAFTLVEMLIVVALIATLMTIVLKLSSVGSDESCRNTTVLRMAKLENCLSGYYAAYGSYPPVRLHNSRDINEPVNSLGDQGSDTAPVNLWSWNVQTFRKDIKAYGYSTKDDEKRAWNQVKAACEAQPLALESPDPDTDGISEAFKSVIDAVRANMASGDFKYYPKKDGDSGFAAWNNGFATIYDNLNSVDDKIPWSAAKICKFGLMSFLLPRYQAMMGWRDTMFSGGKCVFDQWNANNGSNPHDPFTGDELTWKEVNDLVRRANGSNGGSNSEMREQRARLEAIPSEAVVARWMPNLEGICTCDYTDLKFFGVTINASGSSTGMFSVSSDKDSTPPTVKVYSPQGGDSTAGLYHLQQITVRDGWGTEFFYYSPSPHQMYQLWSAGKNKRTFPVWISRQGLDSAAKERVAAWTEDDLRGMSN